ncbi:MAG: UDP-N-acetylmuramate dehydrogenase [Acidimicrobiales bacterium]
MGAPPVGLDAALAELGGLGGLAQRDVPLGARTTYRVGGAAAILVEAESVPDLSRVASAVAASGLPTLVVGKGSNLLVADTGFPGIAVVLGPSFEAIAVEGTDVTAGGAASLPVLARRTAAEGLTGLEWAVGVPGTVGGGVRMNAGGHGSDVAATLRSIHAFDLRTGDHGTVVAADLALGYRRSAVGAGTVVVDATFALAQGDADAATAAVKEIVRWRREHQPGGQNAGSVFTNPPGDSAGRLVDEAGCRGLRHGTAQVSPKHANFIQADPDGSADDVLALIHLVAERVRVETGVELRPEVRLAGFADTAPEPPHPKGEVEG